MLTETQLKESTISGSSLMVLMFTDIVDSVGTKTRVGGAGYARMLARHDELFRAIMGATPRAKIIQDTGDGFLARFATGSDAVNAALQFQMAMTREGRGADRLRVRIGLHVGEVQEIGGLGDAGSWSESKVVGLPADLTARLMSLAVGDQILLTRTIFDDARQYVRELPRMIGATESTAEESDGSRLRWMAHGQYLLKGNPEPIDIFEVGAEGVSPLRAPPDSEKARRSVTLSEEETLGWRPAAGLEVPKRQGWSLVKKLGEGGFGEVWLGRHNRTKENRVFKFCFDSDRLRSFKRELFLFRLLRDVLGNRPDIARLYEVQLDASPYFLETEFSEKGDLGDYVKQLPGGVHGLTIEQRLDIVRRTAESVAAAHSVGVLHKDIKPSNILMYMGEDGQVRPRLADFGIGMLTDRSKLAGRNITVTGLTEDMVAENQSSRTGTRLYAPPEILQNKPFTAQGDVFALGVMLYQMVVGDLERPLAAGWEKGVADPVLREDIAACVAGDLAVRLASAKELAQRLATLPQRRAARRRRQLTKVAAGASVFLLAAAVLAGGWAVREQDLRQKAEQAEKAALAAETEAKAQRDRVERMAKRDRELAQEFIKDFAKKVEQLPGATPARSLLTEAAVKWLEGRAADPELLTDDVRLELAEGYGVLGDLQASTRGGGTGQTDQAIGSYTRAVDYAGAARGNRPGDGPATQAEARARMRLADGYRRAGRGAEAMVEAERGIAVAEELVKLKPADREAARTRYSTLQEAADLYVSAKDQPKAEAALRRSVELRRELAQAVAGDKEASAIVRRDLAGGLLRLASYSVEVLGEKKPEAEATKAGLGLYAEAMDLRRALFKEHPGESRYERDLHGTLMSYARWLVTLQRLDEAEPIAVEAIESARRLLAEDVNELRGVADLARALELAGTVKFSRGNAAGAAEHFREEVSTAKGLVERDPSVLHRKIEATAHYWLAKALGQAGDKAGALAAAGKSLEIYAALSAADPANESLKTDAERAKKLAESFAQP